MAFNHILFNQGTQFGSLLRSALRKSEEADDELADVRDLMIQMRDGDGSQDAQYAENVKRFEFGGYTSTQGTPSAAQLALARAAFEEIDSAYSKTSGNGTVSNVRAARDQMFSKLRG